MSTVKINQKTYVVPQLNFSHVVAMEDMGFSLMEMFKKQQMFLLATAFVGVVVGCTREESEELCQQHILGGGNIYDIGIAFNQAVSESAFFKKLLKIEENTKAEDSEAEVAEKKAAPKKNTKTLQKTEE